MWDRRDINKYMRKLEADKDAHTGPTLMEPEVEEKAELAAFCAQPETLQPVDDINIRLLVHLQMGDTPLQMTDIEVMLHVPEFSQVLFSFGRSFILPSSLNISSSSSSSSSPAAAASVSSSFDLRILKDLCTVCSGHCCRSRSWNL